MPTDEEFEELKGRIVELENQLGQRGVKRTSEPITPEEMQAFAKVRDVLAADWGGFCGVNDCFRCIVQNCWQPCITRCLPPPCIVECTCGPCNIGAAGGGGLSRFGGLGG
jgi:hypothetical protein